MQTKMALKPAQLEWQDTTPVSVSFDDFYFSTDDGISESRYVYLDPNQIPQRFLEGNLTEPFIVAETGFGTGLNFLLTWQAWKQQPRPKRPLHFFSIEKSPLTKADLQQSLSNWPELNEFIQPLLEQYPSLVPGNQILEFESGAVSLSLLFGDVSTDLASISFKADAWYLDGFSPKKNPEMWTERFFALVNQRSKESTTFSTFTSASIVRNRLKQAGFDVQKQEGFGKKREMLFGVFSHHTEEVQGKKRALWSLPEPKTINVFDKSISPNKDVYDAAIIGAGLSGLATAFELAQQGLNVALIDTNSGPVKGASGQSQLAMYAKLPSEANKLFHFTLQALSGSMRFYNRLQCDAYRHNSDTFWHQTGLLQLAWNDKERIKQRSFIENVQLADELIKSVDAKFASKMSGLDITVPALWFEQAGWLDPINYAKEILTKARIETFFTSQVQNLILEESTQHWSLLDKNSTERLKAKNVIIASANSAKEFDFLKHLPTKPLRGQVTSIKTDSLTAPKTVVCGEGYLCPPLKGRHHFGATFDLKCNEAIIKETDTKKNIQSIQNWLPEWLQADALKDAAIEDSVGLRCTTPDYLPIVGRVPIAEKMMTNFAKLRVDSNACNELYGSYFPNLFINIGHGSKGLITSPLAAQIIRYHICGGLPPCIDEHLVMLSPARFLIKHLIQRRI